MIMAPEYPEWFRIRSLVNDYVVAIDRSLPKQDLLRSQVYLYPAQRDDFELWQWDGQYLKNKATDLVLDIRKGRLRLIEDTEICLFTQKPKEKGLNQRWTTRQCMDDFGREQSGCFVCSISNDEWVLEVQHASDQHPKLLLFPARDFDNDNQRWEFEPADAIPDTLSCPADLTLLDTTPISREASPRKRGSSSSVGSASSVEAFKEAHLLVYLEHQPHVSDKTIGMAAAYQALQQWKLQQVEAMAAFDSKSINSSTPIQKLLQDIAETEAMLIYERCDQLNNNPQVAQSLAAMLVLKLHEQQPTTP